MIYHEDFDDDGSQINQDPKEHSIGFKVRSARADNVEYPEGAFTHNLGDFFFYSNFTLIRVYGCNQAPHMLPIIVAPRLAFIEFIWQMLWSKKDQIRTKKKGQHLPLMVKFNEFNVGCDTLDKVQEFLVNNYKLKVFKERNYDPEGYINDVRTNNLRVRGFTCHFNERGDLIRNAYPSEPLQRRRKWNHLSKLERERT